MPEQPIRWEAEALWEQLVPLLPDISIEVLPRTSSTNSVLLERGRAVPPRRGQSGETDGDVVPMVGQRPGRGGGASGGRAAG